MSGGNWENAPFLIQQNLAYVADTEEEDNYTKTEFPELSKILSRLADVLYEIIHTMDYDASRDQSIKDKKAYQKYAIKLLEKTIKGGKDDVKG